MATQLYLLQCYQRVNPISEDEKNDAFWHINSQTIKGGNVGANVAIFGGFTVCLEFALNSQLWGLYVALCKLKNVTDLQLGSVRFAVTVTVFCRGLGRNSVTKLFLCNWLVFLTSCKRYTAKNPWLHKPPGGYMTHLLTLIEAQSFENISPLSLPAQ
jgi:hypothetical protein